MSEKKRTAIILTIVIISTFLLIAGFYYVQASGNRRQAFHTGELLIEQIEMQLERSESQRNALTTSVKEDYITRARAVAYILDHDPLIAADLNEMKKIARLVDVDEIYIFDIGGTIYSGTNYRAIGMNLDSGEQMSYFKPMLSDKNLAMCQDAVPNTLEGKMMMYAMCWSENGDRMIQVGVDPQNLLNEYRQNDVATIVEGMIASEGLGIYVADALTGAIRGASNAEHKEKTLAQIGIDTSDITSDSTKNVIEKVDGHPSYVSVKKSGEYYVGIVQTFAAVNENIRRGMIMMTIYIVCAVVIVYFVIRTLNRQRLNEQLNANSDQMTGLANRRAYEKTIDELARNPEKDIIYISMDLNGLKTINDSHGHDAGDKLIKGAAACMKEVFDAHKTQIYRIGGDEFCAIMTSDFYQLDEYKIDFKRELIKWTEENGIELSVSCGAARRSDHPELSIYDLAKVADERMYEEKEAYYSVAGRNRRRRGNRTENNTKEKQQQ